MDNKIFITSDLHLGHENIIKYCNRPYSNVHDMNEDLIKKWNNTVSDNDRVFFLGDFGLGSRDEVIEWGQVLQGRKVMIYGNHDHFKPNVYYKAGFELVSRWPIVIQSRYLLSHAPLIYGDDAIDIGDLINIHGHIHNKVELVPTISERSVCVCPERWDYAPVELRTIEKMIKNCRR